jgi:hypothetical protein
MIYVPPRVTRLAQTFKQSLQHYEITKYFAGMRFVSDRR